MSAVATRPPTGPAGARRSHRSRGGRIGHRSGAYHERVDCEPRRPVVLRCPGPLVALRGLAALYRVSEQRLAALLAACETRAGSTTDPGGLESAVSDALGTPLTPVCVHYFRATWLADPRRSLEHGIDGSPHGPGGCLVRDVVLRSAVYGTRDHLEPPVPGRVPTATLCIVEYRRPPAPDRRDVDAALRFVAAALRGAVSPFVIGADDGAPLAARDIVSVRAIATQAEWTPRPAIKAG